MNSFIMQKKIGDMWVKLPESFIGGDESGTTPRIMRRFSGMVFDLLRAGSCNLPKSECLLPNGDNVTFDLYLYTNNEIRNTRLCLGFIMLEDISIFGDGNYQIESIIDNGEKTFAAFTCAFTINEGKIINYEWTNGTDFSLPLGIKKMNSTNNTRSFPVIFGIGFSDEFDKSFIIDETNINIPRYYGLPAQWVKPIEYDGINPVAINFTVEKESKNEFKLPEDIRQYAGKSVILPSYDNVFCKNYKPLKWKIEDIEYSLGESYIVSDRNATAELIYEVRNCTGVTIS